jgi:predicted DsbA family dithiol-disulfide isomerase
VQTVLYTDLNCPFCYATETRLAALGLEDAVEWRGVEHEPDLPVPMLDDDEDIADELADEVSQIRTRAPEVEIALPPGKPNTERALRAAAAVQRENPAQAPAFRRAVYRAFWIEGADLSQPEVLDQLAYEHGVSSLEIRPEDALTVSQWRFDWESSPLRGVPLAVRSDGEVLYGLKDIDVLQAFVNGSGS